MRSKDTGEPCCSIHISPRESPLTLSFSCPDICRGILVTKPVWLQGQAASKNLYPDTSLAVTTVSTSLSVHTTSSDFPVPNTHGTPPSRSTLSSLLLTPATRALVLRGTLVLVSRICRAGSL